MHDSILFNGQSGQMTLILTMNSLIFIDLQYLDQHMVEQRLNCIKRQKKIYALLSDISNPDPQSESCIIRDSMPQAAIPSKADVCFAQT